MSDFLLGASRVFLAVVFVVAAAGKLRDRDGARRSATELGIPRALAPSVAIVLPVAELAIAVGLTVDGLVAWASAAALVLLAAFLVAIAANMAAGRRPACRCFGQRDAVPVGWAIVTRDLGLATVAAYVLISAAGTGRPGPGPAASLRTPGALALALGGALLAIALGWRVLVDLVAQQGRLLARIEALEEVARRSDHDAPWTPPVGSVAPDFVLPAAGGGRLALAELRGRGHPVVLVFSDSHCAACEEVMADVGRWQLEHAGVLTFAVLEADPTAAERSEAAQEAGHHDLTSVARLVGNDPAGAFGVRGTPSAVAIGPDGRIIAPLAEGPQAIRQLVGRVVAAVRGRASEGRGAGTPHRERLPDTTIRSLSGRSTR